MNADEVCVTVNGMISDAYGSRSKMKSSLEAITRMLMAAGLAYMEWIPIWRLGVHRENRFGSGLVASPVLKLLWKIIEAGWSWAECAGGICFEAPATQKEKQVGADVQWNAGRVQI